jgi:hypothetical protein
MKLESIRSRFSPRVFLPLFIVTLLSVCASAQDDNRPPKGFTTLFNGRDFNNWIGGIGTVDWRKVEAMPQKERAERQTHLNDGIHKHWHVEDGVLVSDGDQNFFLSTPREYTDFEMWVDWKINKDGDSGIYLRGVPQVQIWDPADPNQQKNGCYRGSGALWNNQVHEKWPLVKADKPVGQWNRMFIRMVGPYVTVTLNGKKTVDNVPLENYFDKKTPVPLSGPIYLQTHTTPLYFRNIFIREIKPREANRYLAKIGGGDEDFKPLFNGKDLSGWTNATDAYEVVKGTLVSKQGKHGNMFTKDTFDNFTVRLEFKLPPGNGNNGLALRSPITDKEVAYEGMECQILSAYYPDKLHEYQYHGSLYGLAPALHGYLRPVGQWNFEEVTLNGDKMTVDLNGFRILDTDIAKVREKPMDGKEHPGAFRKDGHFGLLGHQDPVAFRNIRIKRIQKGDLTAKSHASGGG